MHDTRRHDWSECWIADVCVLLRSEERRSLLQVLPERMAKVRAGEKDARGVLGDFSQWAWEAQLPLAQAGACDYVVEST